MAAQQTHYQLEDQPSDQPIHPEILKHNIKAGDFIMVALDNETRKTFLVAMVSGDKVFIHPGARPSQMKVLSPGDIPNEWILTNNIVGAKIIDWSHQPVPNKVDEIRVVWTDQKYYEERAIHFMSQDNDESMDYRLIKEAIMNYVKILESDTTKPLVEYKVVDSQFWGEHLAGYDEDIRVKARTDVGAKVTYMNWLDTQDNVWFDEYMWDQTDQFDFNVNSWRSIEDLVDEFNDNFDVMEKVPEKPPPILFPGPQNDLIKSARD